MPPSTPARGLGAFKTTEAKMEKEIEKLKKQNEKLKFEIDVLKKVLKKMEAKKCVKD